MGHSLSTVMPKNTAVCDDTLLFSRIICQTICQFGSEKETTFKTDILGIKVPFSSSLLVFQTAGSDKNICSDNKRELKDKKY